MNFKMAVGDQTGTHGSMTRLKLNQCIDCKRSYEQSE